MPAYVNPIGPSRYWKWLQSIRPYKTPLAWCHTTDAYVLRSMIESGVLAPRLCDVFGEDLLYFFYGRPAFRPVGKIVIDTGGRAPVVIILDPQLAARGTRLFPFDTGAFAGNRYETWMHCSMQLADFELSCPSDAPQRQVSAFFGDNARYLRIDARKPAAPYAGLFEVQSLVSLLTDHNTATSDDRRGAVELQVAETIPFEYPTVRALILPDELLQAPYLQSFLKTGGAGIEIREYALTPLRDAREYQYYMEAQVLRLQAAWGFL